MSTITIESEKQGTPTFITTEIKSKTTFTDSLAKLAGTDAKHDFGLAYALLDKIQVGLPKSGWPTENEKKHPFFDESGSLSSVLREQSKTEPISLKKLIPTASDANTSDPPVTVNFGINYDSSVNVLHNYSGMKVIIKDSSGTFTDGAKFVTKCNLSDSVLVVDFNQNGFLEMLTRGKVDSSMTVNYVMIPELLNDPAGKTPLDDTIFKKYNNGIGTGINLRPLLDITNKTIVYDAYDKLNDVFSNNFFSNCNLQLSPIIITKQISGKSQTLHVTLNIISTKGSTRQVEVKNCKKENSIKSLLKFLTSLFKKDTDESKFNYSAKLQQKRSGDWVQVLACLDIYNRTFKHANSTDQIKFKPANKVYFVTHDQIACAYALTMGVNAIFINEKYAYVLTNQLTETTSTPEERLRSAYRAFISEQSGVKFKNLITFLNGYAKLRETYKNKYINLIYAGLNNLKSEMSKQGNKCASDASATVYSDIIKTIFTNCVMYCHMIMSLPDPKNITPTPSGSLTPNFLDDNHQAAITSDSDITNVTTKQYINDFVGAYNLATSIHRQHNGEVDENTKWIDALQKSDAYKSASLWSWGYKKSGRIRNFITTITGTPTETKNDMYLFLSFIGSIDDNIANQITATFDEYENVVTATKTVAWTTKDLFVSNNIELIKQIRVFLTRVASKEKFDANKNYFINETAAASLYIDTITKEITISETNFNEPSYWGRCTEEEIMPENTESIRNDNNNPIIENNENKEVVAEEFNYASAYIADSCDNDGEQTGGKKGGFKSNATDPNAKFQMVTDVSIQETSAPLLTAFLIYEFYTPNVQLILDAQEPLDSQEILDKKNAITYGDYSEDGTISTDDNLQIGGAFDINDVKISDKSIAYHPLLPIYMIACGYNYNVTSDLEGSLDYDVYIKYLGFLEKMTSVLTGYNYLSNVGQNKSNNIAKSYIIGLALRELLFTLNRDEDGIKILCENGANSALNATRDEYQSFSLMSSMLSDYISGKILEDATEKAFGVQLLQSSVFKNFINVEVDIKSLLNKTLTQQEESISISALNQRSLDLIKKISDRIAKDRSPGSGNASQGISSSQLSTISMKTGTTPDTLSSLTSSLTSPIGVGGFLKTKKQKRKNNRNMKTKRRKNKRSNKQTKKKHRRRKQRKQTRKQ